MKNIAGLLLAVLFFSVTDARAMQGYSFFQIDEMVEYNNPTLRSDFFQYMVRPYRDRTERFQSSRTDALQMSLAVDDESDQLTLENWGDNRADIRSGSSMVKVEGSGITGNTYNADGTNDQKYSGNLAGVYGRFGTFEAEGSQLSQEAQTYNSSTKNKYEKTSAGAGFSFGGDGVRLGLHGNMNSGKDPDANLELPNNAGGAALALRTGVFELGATADYVDRGVKDPDSNLQVTRSGPQFGAQALIKPFGGFTAALRASIAKLSGTYDHSGNNADFTGDNSELGARVEWKFKAVPLTVAASYDKLMMTPEYKRSGFSQRVETENSRKAAGAAFHFFGGRFLVGAEAQELKMKYTEYVNNSLYNYNSDEMTGNTITGGAELWLLPGFGLRASYQRLDWKNPGNESFENTMAAGAGLKGKKLSLDFSVRKISSDNQVAKQDEITEMKAMLGYKF